MVEAKHCVGLVVTLILLSSMQVGVQYAMAQPTVWVVYTDSPDMNEEIAARVLTNEVTLAGCSVGVTSIEKLDVIPLSSDAIVVIGHGGPDGIEAFGSVLPWEDTNGLLNERNPRMLVYLSCYSPSDPALNIFGFSGSIDAEAGALLAAWKVTDFLFHKRQTRIPLYRVLESQFEMKHPLGSWVYFAHGYYGNESNFADMIQKTDLMLSRYDGFSYFSYFDAFVNMTKEAVHDIPGGISTYAQNFADQLVIAHPPGTQIDIVAHSLGGIITRDMVRLCRPMLEAAGIEIGRVITLGSPHSGTEIATFDLVPVAFAFVQLCFGQCWPSAVFYSLHPLSPFIFNLNFNASGYSEGIEWYTIGGVDPIWSDVLQLAGAHSGPNDGLVTVSNSHLFFATNSTTLPCGHSTLISGRNEYPFVSDWLLGGFDSDQDGLLDVEERRVYSTNPFECDSDGDAVDDYDEIFVHYTNPNSSDGDGDGYTDYEEVFVHGTNPNAWSTDGDILSDSQEILWGYDPFDTDDPIDAEYLTYSAWQCHEFGFVRANHYQAMDYIKVYVKYRTNYGTWTGYSYVGTDYTPTYYGDYYVSWTYLTGYIEMCVVVKAYDQASHYLGCDQQYVSLPGGGGGGPLPI